MFPQMKTPHAASSKHTSNLVVELLLTLLVLLALSACRAEAPVPEPVQQRSDAPAKLLPQEAALVAEPTERPLPPPTAKPFASPSGLVAAVTRPATAVLQAVETIAATHTAMPATAVPVGACQARIPTADLLAIVTLTYGLSREFEPADLVPLADYLPYSVTLGYPSELRRVAAEPLTRMIDDMIAAGLQPQVLSGYRSYPAQAIAWKKWNELYPEHASIISAPPGFSEHQLGTVVDFGSPELPGIVGDPDIQFHTYFYKTSEGQWLSEHAHRYGFTLSYTEEAFETSGFYYEPWHYRYVGEEMAAKLREQGITLTEFQLANAAAPCIP